MITVAIASENSLYDAQVYRQLLSMLLQTEVDIWSRHFSRTCPTVRQVRANFARPPGLGGLWRQGLAGLGYTGDAVGLAECHGLLAGRHQAAQQVLICHVEQRRQGARCQRALEVLRQRPCFQRFEARLAGW